MIGGEEWMENEMGGVVTPLLPGYSCDCALNSIKYHRCKPIKSVMHSKTFFVLTDYTLTHRHTGKTTIMEQILHRNLACQVRE